MKKHFILVIALISCSLISSAQDIKLGFKTGINFSSLSGDNITIGGRLEGSTGYHIGVVAQLGLSSKFAVQPEISYTTEGAKDVDIDFINLPVLIKFKFAKFFSIEAGPQLGLAVNNDLPTESEPKDFNFNTVIGLGAEFGSYFVQLRYTTAGIGNLDLSTSLVDSSIPDVRYENLQISIGYYIF